MLSEHQRLEKEIKAIQAKIHEFPDGKLICTHNGKRTKWYQTDGHTQTYIPKENRKLAEQLAAKKYLSTLEKELRQEQTAIDFYLRHHNKNTGRAEQLLSDQSEYSELLSPFFTPLSIELFDCMNSPYLHNDKNPELLIYKISPGKYVRSKSESMIAMLLQMNRIPFRYECALQLGDITLFPDFTIRHPQTGQLFYWEHFGMMDNPAYARNAFSKLQLYNANEIIPSIDLLTTFETKNNPLSPEMVKKMVDYYFLS